MFNPYRYRIIPSLFKLRRFFFVKDSTRFINTIVSKNIESKWFEFLRQTTEKLQQKVFTLYPNNFFIEVKSFIYTFLEFSFVCDKLFPSQGNSSSIMIMLHIYYHVLIDQYSVVLETNQTCICICFSIKHV